MPKPEDTRVNAAHAMYGDNSEFEAAGRAVYEQTVGVADIHGWAGLEEDVKSFHRNTARVAVEAYRQDMLQRMGAISTLTVGGGGGGTA